MYCLPYRPRHSSSAGSEATVTGGLFCFDTPTLAEIVEKIMTDQQQDSTPAPVSPAVPTPAPEGKVYTQAQLDAMFAERAKRAEASAQAAILQALNVTDVESAKALLAKAQAQPAQDNGALSRLESELKALQAKLEAADAAKVQAEQARLHQLRDSALMDAAKSSGAVDAQAVLTLAQAGKLTDGLLKDDGTIDSDKVKSAIEAMKKDKPYLFVPERPNYKGIPSSATKPNPNPSADKEAAARDALAKLVFNRK